MLRLHIDIAPKGNSFQHDPLHMLGAKAGARIIFSMLPHSLVVTQEHDNATGSCFLSWLVGFGSSAFIGGQITGVVPGLRFIC